MGVFDKASLALVPDGIKDGKLYSIKPTDGSGDFTFERGSNLAATRVDENGLIEKGRENLLENSVWDGVTTNIKPTGWTAQSVTGTGTFDVTSTEGQIRFQTFDANSRAFIYSPNISTNGILTVSVYVDQVYTTCPINQVIVRSGNATIISYFEDGVEISQTTNVQAGKRYSVVFNKTDTTTFRFGVGASSNTLGDIVLSRPQLEQGLVVTDYIETGASTAQAGVLEDLPRIDYTGGTPSLLLEPQRTNLIANSEYFAGYSNTNSTDEVNATTSPEGLTNATFFKEDTSTGIHLLNESIITVAGVYTASVFVKANGRDRILLNIAPASNYGAYFDLSNGTTDTIQSNITSATIEDYGNGWYRCSITADTATDSLSPRIAIYLALSNNEINYTGDGTSGIYIYGAQIEQASYPTSYIPTYGAIATRGAESIPQKTINPTSNNTFTVFFELNLDNMFLDSNEQFLLLRDFASTTYQSFRMFQKSSIDFVVAPYFDVDTTYPFGTNGSLNRTDTGKIVLRANGDGSYDMFIRYNGTTNKRSGSGLTAYNLSKISLLGNTLINLKSCLVFDDPLSDAECITLTT